MFENFLNKGIWFLVSGCVGVLTFGALKVIDHESRITIIEHTRYTDKDAERRIVPIESQLIETTELSKLNKAELEKRLLRFEYMEKAITSNGGAIQEVKQILLDKIK